MCVLIISAMCDVASDRHTIDSSYSAVTHWNISEVPSLYCVVLGVQSVTFQSSPYSTIGCIHTVSWERTDAQVLSMCHALRDCHRQVVGLYLRIVDISIRGCIPIAHSQEQCEEFAFKHAPTLWLPIVHQGAAIVGVVYSGSHAMAY
jgi:hypothetical protein